MVTAVGPLLGSPRNHCEQIFLRTDCIFFKTLLAQESSNSWGETAQDQIRRCSSLSSHDPAAWRQCLSRLHTDQRPWRLCCHSTVERCQCLSCFKYSRRQCISSTKLSPCDCCISNISTYQSVTSTRPSNVREDVQSVQGVANCIQLQAGQ